MRRLQARRTVGHGSGGWTGRVSLLLLLRWRRRQVLGRHGPLIGHHPLRLLLVMRMMVRVLLRRIQFLDGLLSVVGFV